MEQLREYENRIEEMLKHHSKLTSADMPRVLTVDASQGQESFMVIFDGSFQHADVIGMTPTCPRFVCCC